MTSTKSFNKTFQMIPQDFLAMRIDKFLTLQFKDKTRSYLQKIIEDGSVLVNGQKVKSSYKLSEKDKINVEFPALKELKLKPKKIDLEIIYEDKNLLVINKPAGITVHPGMGESHIEDSLVNALLYYCKDSLSGIGGVLRPGIVHRLDKDTSGLLVVAKNDKTHQHLFAQFKNREVQKTYYALVCGNLQPSKGTIDSPISRDKVDRKKMAVVGKHIAKEAVTKYKVLSYLQNDTLGEYSFVEINLITGRTHQIRVHFSAIGFSLVGDVIYGREKINKLFKDKFGLKRVFLHSGKIAFKLSGAKSKKVEFNSALPEDLQKVLKHI